MPMITRPSRLPAVFAAAYAVLLFAAGCHLHPMIMMSAETDNYVGMARLLLKGEFVRDVFHPLLYPTLTAALGAVIGDFFVAAKAVSAAAAGLLVWTMYRLAAATLAPLPRVLVPVLVALHPYVVVQAMMATDCMLSTALCAAVVLVSVELHAGHAWRRVLLLGWLVAMAYWSRYSTMALAVPVLIALLLPRDVDLRCKIQRLLVFGLVVVCCLTPHFALTYAQFGRPLHDENWRNLALSHYYGFDWNRLYDMPFSSWAEVMRHDPAKLIAGALRNLANLFGSELPAHLTARETWEVGWPDWIVYASVGIGLAAAVVRRAAGLVIAGSFSLAYLAALAAMFYAFASHVTLALPGLLLSSGLVVGELGRLLVRSPRCGAILQAGLALALAGYVCWRTPAALARLRDEQPVAEYEAVRKLTAAHSPEVAIYVPYLAWAFENHFAFSARQEFYPSQPLDRTAFLRDLQAAAASGSARFFVFGAVTMKGRDQFAALVSGLFPAPLRVVERTPEVLILEADTLGGPPEMPQLVVGPDPYAGGEVMVSVFLRTPPPGMVGLGVHVRDPGGRSDVWELDSSGRSCAFQALVPGSLSAGTWVLEPYARTSTGVIAGTAVTWRVQ